MREESNDIETRAAVLTDAADLINSALKLFEGLEDDTLDDLEGILDDARDEVAFQLKEIRDSLREPPDDDELLKMKHEADRYGYNPDWGEVVSRKVYRYTDEGYKLVSEENF